MHYKEELQWDDVRLLIDRCADRDFGPPFVLFTGSRGWLQMEPLYNVVDYAVKTAGCSVVVGDCPHGADMLVRARMGQLQKPYLQGMAMWSSGKSAGMQRNALMIRAAGMVIGFWDGESRGTENSIESGARMTGASVYLLPDGTWYRAGKVI